MKLKEILKNKNYSQKEIAKRMSMSPTGFNKWVTGENEPNIDSIRKLCDILGVSADMLLDANRKGYVQIEMEQEEAVQLASILEKVLEQIHLQVNGNVQVNVAQNITINMGDSKVENQNSTKEDEQD